MVSIYYDEPWGLTRLTLLEGTLGLILMKLTLIIEHLALLYSGELTGMTDAKEVGVPDRKRH